MKSAVSTRITVSDATAAAIIQFRWRRFCDSSSRISAWFIVPRPFLPCEAACHSRRISKVAAPKINTKKNNSFRTIGPKIAISALLEGSQRASLNSCKPVSAS